MANPIYYDSMVLLVKPETTYRSDSAPTATNAILAVDIELSQPMMAETRDRALVRPFMGNDNELVGTPLRKLRGRVELAGSGTAGTVPKSGVILRALGLQEAIAAGVSVTYTPISSGFESVTVYFWHDGLRHIITGARGTGEIKLSAQGIPTLDFELTGFWQSPSDTAQVTPTLTGWLAPLLSSSTNTPTFTIGASPAVMSEYALQLGNQVEPYLLVGREEIMIANRKEQLRFTAEALPIATRDLQAIAVARTLQAITVVQGTAAGNIVTIAAPTCEIAPDIAYRRISNVLHNAVTAKPQPTNAGNNQFSIVFT